MPKLLSGFIAKTLAKKLGPQVKAVTLIKVAAGTRTAGNLSGGTNPTTTSYSARGWSETYLKNQLDGSLVVVGDIKISVLGASIPGGVVPAQDDKLVFGGITYRVVSAPSVDPDNAVFECQCRGLG